MAQLKNVSSLKQLRSLGPGQYKIAYKVGGKTFNFMVNVGRLNKDASITLNGYGQNGTGNSVLKYFNPSSNGIDVVIQAGNGGSGYQTSGWQQAAGTFLKDLSNTFNISSDKTVLTGFSYSAEMTAKFAAQYARNNNAKNFCAVITESSWGQNVKLTDSERQSLIDNNVTLFNLYQKGSRSLINHMSNLKGVHIVDVAVGVRGSGADRHVLPYLVTMDSGINNIGNGGFSFNDLPKTYNYQGQKLNLYYEYTEHYVNEKGEYVTRKISAEEAQNLVDEMYKANLENLYQKNSNLSDFAKACGTKDNTLASNLSFVSNSMDLIKGKITAHNDINYNKKSSDEAGVIGALYSSANYYGAVTNALYGNLSAEADAVYAIANAIYKMDGVAAVLAETNLTDSVKGLFNSGNVSAELNKLKQTTSDLFNNAKNAVTANGRYDEISKILGNPITEGKVGKISVDALKNAVNSIIPSLNEEIDKANALKSGVDGFMSGIGSSSLLQGGVWNDVKTNMESYQNLLDCNSKAATFISDTLKTAMGIIVDYMGEDIELDDSKLPELKVQRDEMTTKLEEMAAELSRMKSCTKAGPSTTVTDPETGEPQQVPGPDVPCYTDGEISAYNSQILAKEELKKELDKDIEKLEGLAPIVESAQKIIQSAIDQVKSMYENPVKGTNGNQSFVADFKLDLSAYGINSDKDYKKIIDDYYEKLNAKTTATPNTNTQKAGNGEDGNYGNYGGYSGGGRNGGNNSKPKTPSLSGALSVNEAVEGELVGIEEVSTEITSGIEEIIEQVSEPTTGIGEIYYTEITTEISTNAQGQELIIVEEKKKPHPTNKKIEPTIEVSTTPTEDTIETTNNVDDDLDNLVSEYLEDEIPIPVETTIDKQPEIVNIDDKSDKLSTMGLASAIGVAVGSAAIGVHKILKDNDDENLDKEKE